MLLLEYVTIIYTDKIATESLSAKIIFKFWEEKGYFGPNVTIFLFWPKLTYPKVSNTNLLMVRPISISVKICLNISKFNLTVTNPTAISKNQDSVKKKFL